ncbi:hypothetical protein [uncultured Roseobacter sp.]|uniref:hypothetical protein n=1 Tax=uncultured Roseobacter sp. TaxID=114847 RepID=UPI00262860D2|nr:hypothetical protein [uncultured Roseobacter sp.]
MHRLKIERLPSNDGGRLLVRVHKQYRNGIDRYGIAELRNAQNEKSVRVLVLGHERDDAIFMPYDIRTALGVKKGGDLEFSISPENWYGKLRWYLGTPDPAVHIPAWIALIALVLSVLGLVLGGLSFFC